VGKEGGLNGWGVGVDWKGGRRKGREGGEGVGWSLSFGHGRISEGEREFWGRGNKKGTMKVGRRAA
jgi:hypothetical protein